MLNFKNINTVQLLLKNKKSKNKQMINAKNLILTHERKIGRQLDEKQNAKMLVESKMKTNVLVN